MEDLGPILAQLLVQLSYSGMYLITRVALDDGMSTFVYVTYRQIIATLVISPFAYFIERITINQNLYFTGLADTSSTFVATINNLIPAITFVIAFLLRLETVNIKSFRGVAKIVGTCVCVGGAMIMSLLKGPALKFLKFHNPQASPFSILDAADVSGLSISTWFLGSIFVCVSTFAWSCWVILQAWVVREYPPQLSLTAWMCFFATIQSAIIALICADHSAWKLGWDLELLSYVYSGVFCSAFAFFIQCWCVKKKGPVFATAFSPLSTVLVAILEPIFLHVYLHVGSLVGMVLVIGGLYCLLWGKAKDGIDGESSSARGKSMSGPLSMGMSPIPTRSNSFQASSSSAPSTRERRTWPVSRDGVSSVRTRRSTIGDTRTMLTEHEKANVLSLPEPVMISPLPQPDLSTDESCLASSSRSVSIELSSVSQNIYGQINSSQETARRRGITRIDDIRSRSLHGISIDRESYRHFNMEGIAEVLYALDRIGHEEELTYEQLLIVETSLLVSGLSSHDQHRDMRLDIDNMSYEELLALEEKMGSVSTALTEEALSNCLKRGYYKNDPSTSEFAGSRDDNDVKCSICQEEYAVGDEVGRLRCEHCYHATCIQQWLRQKNWCPVCKASASPS